LWEIEEELNLIFLQLTGFAVGVFVGIVVGDFVGDFV
jgi:hypothetical protein